MFGRATIRLGIGPHSSSTGRCSLSPKLSAYDTRQRHRITDPGRIVLQILLHLKPNCLAVGLLLKPPFACMQMKNTSKKYCDSL